MPSRNTRVRSNWPSGCAPWDSSLEPESPIKGFHEDTEEREEILSQRHKDAKIEKPFMAFYLFFFFVSLCLCESIFFFGESP